MSPFWKIGRLIAYKALAEVVSKLATFLTLVLAARFLSTELFGILSLAYLSGWILGITSDFGAQTYLFREVARRPGEAAEIFGFLLRRRLFTGGTMFLALAVFSALTGWPGETAGFLLIVGAQLEAAVIEFICHYFRGLERSELESSLQITIRPISVIALFFGLLPSPNLLTFGLILCFIFSLGLVVTLMIAHKLRVSSAPSPPQTSPSTLRGAFREMAPIGVGILLSGLYFRSDLYLIEWWTGLTAVGLYNSVYRIVDALRLIPAAVLAVIFPSLCRQSSSGLLARTATPMLALSAVLLLFIEWRAEDVVRIAFGSAYLAAVPAFRILLLALPLLYLNYLLTHQLIAWRRQGLFAFFCGGGLVFNLVSNVLLIPRYGMIGAAWSTVLTELLLTLCWIICIYKISHLLTSESSLKARHVRA